ncbi:hypothetical protein HanPI659440_Chr04g0179371 [Helianthus annuus]|nr:hypothetical protein HanPI659440_Chr04g0179371 [Helianthus annuus]
MCGIVKCVGLERGFEFLKEEEVKLIRKLTFLFSQLQGELNPVEYDEQIGSGTGIEFTEPGTFSVPIRYRLLIFLVSVRLRYWFLPSNTDTVPVPNRTYRVYSVPVPTFGDFRYLYFRFQYRFDTSRYRAHPYCRANQGALAIKII